MNKVFDFKKERNFDAIIEGSFHFFSNNAKKLLKIIWQQNKIIFTALAIIYILYIFYYLNFFDNLVMLQKGTDIDNKLENVKIFSIISVVMVLFHIIFIPRFLLSIMGYIKVYMNNKGEVSAQEVGEEIKQNFWRIIGLFIIMFLLLIALFYIFSILSTITSELGLTLLTVIILLFFIYYFLLLFTIAIPAFYFEKLGIIDVFTRSIAYLKGNFWKVSGVIIIMLLITWLLNMVINVPLISYFLLKAFWLYDDSNNISNYMGIDIFTSLISVLSFIGEWIVRVIYFITTVILYFSLRESYTQEGIMEKIEQIGANDAK
jgi:hypothetical protein